MANSSVNGAVRPADQSSPQAWPKAFEYSDRIASLAGAAIAQVAPKPPQMNAATVVFAGWLA